ncbi:MAG: macro domain-containing protein, partial [Aureispira sp.]|nr:macro domain-containing protein [Aureispira sp.]
CVAIRNRQGGCKVGEAVITTAGKLPAKNVIHTVGPRWNNNESNEPQKLENCYLNVLKIAEENQLSSLAIPNISTGIYRFPKDKAAQIAIKTIQAHQGDYLQEVIFVCYDDENYQLYQGLLEP